MCCWRPRSSAWPATSTSTRPGAPARRFAPTRSPTTSTCRRGCSTTILAGGRGRRLLRRRVPRLDRDHPLAGAPAVGQRASDRRSDAARAVLPRRARADALDQPLARRLHALLPARRRAAGPASTSIAGLWVLPACCAGTSATASRPRRSVALLFGTSLYHYATFDSVVEPRLLVLPACAALLDLIERWHGRVADAATLRRPAGLVGGLIVLTRHTNILLLARVPALWRRGAQHARRRRGVFARDGASCADRLVVGDGRPAAALALLPRHRRLLVSSYGTWASRSPRRISGACSSASRRGCSSGRRCCCGGRRLALLRGRRGVPVLRALQS